MKLTCWACSLITAAMMLLSSGCQVDPKYTDHVHNDLPECPKDHKGLIKTYYQTAEGKILYHYKGTRRHCLGDK